MRPKTIIDLLSLSVKDRWPSKKQGILVLLSLSPSSACPAETIRFFAPVSEVQLAQESSSWCSFQFDSLASRSVLPFLTPLPSSHTPPTSPFIVAASVRSCNRMQSTSPIKDAVSLPSPVLSSTKVQDGESVKGQTIEWLRAERKQPVMPQSPSSPLLSLAPLPQSLLVFPSFPASSL